MRGERRWVGVTVVALAPWIWFAVRDLGWVFELVANTLPLLFGLAAVALAGFSVVRRRPVMAIGVGSCLLAGGAAVVGPWRPQPIPPPVQGWRIVMANVSSRNAAVDQAVADALAQQGDLVLMLEAGEDPPAPSGFTAVALPSYSNQVILSRFPARLLDRPVNWPKRLRAHRIGVDAPSGRVVVYLAHLVRPHLGLRGVIRLPRQMAAQRRERDALLASARRETAPVVLVGDFNSSDRGRGYRRITDRFRDAMRSRWAGPTYAASLWRPLLLRIDHVFVPRDWCSAEPERFDLRGSDHRGVAVDVGPCPAL
ncbi:MAG: endonuclease/exonuclease/phosphatase family protein [Actinomycetota bacterium]|jgi:vancomycin resistance protein VanJ